MKILPLKLRKNGFNYTQVLRKGKKAIYEQTITSEIKQYEVFKIRTRPDKIFKGNLICGGEVFPGNEDFGKSAWSCRTYDKALERFNNIEE
jgi:hypothetical protein